MTFLSLALFYRFPVCTNTMTSVLIYSNIHILVIKFRLHICFSCFILDFVQCVNIVEKIGDCIPGSILILVLPFTTYLCDLAKPFNFFFQSPFLSYEMEIMISMIVVKIQRGTIRAWCIIAA